MKTPLLLALLAFALAAPALWLLLRRHSRTSAVAASLLLTLATASGYSGIRLWKESPAPPASFISTAPAGHFQTITPAQLPAALEHGKGRPVMLEFYADWCPSCIVWKQTVFSRPDVQQALQPLVLLQIDATELTPETQALLEKYEIAGLPAILVYDPAGKERPELRLPGEMKAEDFIAWIQKDLLPSM